MNDGGTEKYCGETELDRLRAQLAATEAKWAEQHMEAIARLAGGIAHDLNNLLVVIVSNAHLLRDRLHHDHPGMEEIDDILRATERATELTRRLLASGRKQAIHLEIVDLNALLRRALPTLQQLLNDDIELRIDMGAELGLVRADPAQLDRVILHLVLNARDAIGSRGTIDIRTTNVHEKRALAAGDCFECVSFSVRDNGPGMDQATLARIFDPFYTTKGPTSGSGLGLSMVHGIVSQNGGRIDVVSDPGMGTCLEVSFPRITKHAETDATEGRRPSGVIARTVTVLVTEDDRDVRLTVEELLRDAGYHVLVAANADEALAIHASHVGPIDLLLTDVVMPGMNGIALAGELSRARPEIRVLLMSGYTGELNASEQLVNARASFIHKPFTPDKLLSLIEHSLRVHDAT